MFSKLLFLPSKSSMANPTFQSYRLFHHYNFLKIKLKLYAVLDVSVNLVQDTTPAKVICKFISGP